MENSTRSFEDLRLMPGQVLQLEFDNASQFRDRSLLIGYSPGKSILVSTPRVNGVTVPVTLDGDVNVRLFSTRLNGACAFRSRIIHILTRPFAYLHLSPPDHVEMGEVRKSMRAAVEIIASVQYGEDKRATAIIRDISTDGVQLVSKQFDAEIGDEVVVNCKFDVVGIERVLSLASIVRSVTKGENDSCFGLQFVEVSDMDRITLHGYVLSQLHGANG